MSYKKIIRNLYDVQHPPRPHDSNNHNQDMIDFHLTSQHMQNANLHDWGIARGLEVSGKIGSKEIVVYPGVAIDIEGKLISLATNGHGDIGPNPPGQQHHPVPLPVRLSTEGIAKHHVYVTIRYSEMKQNNAGVGGLMEQVPWVRLQPVSGPSPNVYVHDGKTIILAVAYIDTNQKLETLSYEDNNVQYRRQVIGQSIEELRIQRSVKAGDHVKEKDSAILGPASGGGLEIRDAERIVVRDSLEREVFNFDSDAALLNLGNKGNAGDLSVKNNGGTESVGIYGNQGNIKLHGQLLDALGRNIGLTYSQKQDLTDGGIATIHKHDLGNISYWGASGNRIGIIGGWVQINGYESNANTHGDVNIRFSDHSHTPNGEGFEDIHIHGYRGNFSNTPHAILAATQVGLSTDNDTWFSFTYFVGTSSIDINWGVDGDNANDNRVQFLIVGPIPD